MSVMLYLSVLRTPVDKLGGEVKPFVHIECHTHLTIVWRRERLHHDGE